MKKYVWAFMALGLVAFSSCNTEMDVGPNQIDMNKVRLTLEEKDLGEYQGEQCAKVILTLAGLSIENATRLLVSGFYESTSNSLSTGYAAPYHTDSHVFGTIESPNGTVEIEIRGYNQAKNDFTLSTSLSITAINDNDQSIMPTETAARFSGLGLGKSLPCGRTYSIQIKNIGR